MGKEWQRRATGKGQSRVVNRPVLCNISGVKRVVIAVLFLLPAACFIADRWSAPAPSAAPAEPAAASPSSAAPIVQTPSAPATVPPSANQAVTVPAAPAETALDASGTTNAAPEDINQLLRELRALAAQNPEAALAAAMKLPAGDERNQALAAVCFGIAQNDPADAVKMAQSLQQPEDVMENLVQQWSASDVASALVWANSQPAGEPRDQFLQRVAFVLSQTDPSDAAGLVMEQIPSGPVQDEAMMTVLHQWANQDLAAAVKWAQNFPFRNTALQERAVAELEGIQKYRQDLARQ